MAVEACRDKNLMNDMDSDDEPLVFKRRQNHSSAETKKSSSQKPERPSGRPTPEARSQNGQSSNSQKGKTVPSASPPPARSPLVSPKPSNSSGKALTVKSPEVNLKPSSSVSEEQKPVKRPVKTVPSARPPPARSPLVVSPKPSNSSGKVLTVKSPEVNLKPSSSVSEEQKPVKRPIKEEKSSKEATGKPNEDSEDSEDEKPLSARRLTGSKINSDQGNKGLNASSSSDRKSIPKPEDSEDEMPLASRFGAKNNAGASTSKSDNSDIKKHLSVGHDRNGSASIERKPSPIIKKRPVDGVKSSSELSSKKPKLSDASIPNKHKDASVNVEKKEEDDEDHVPISHRMKKPTSSDKKSSFVKSVTKPVSSISKKVSMKSKKFVKNSKYSKPSKVPPGSGDGQKWTTLVHNGVIFPPAYKPHKVKMLYKGKPVELTPEQEEVATMFAVMLDTDYMSKPKFRENFMADWRKILGKNHTIQNLDDCDFSPIYEWHQEEKEKKKQMTSEEKKAAKEEKMKLEEKYMWATVNGVKEKVGNFRVEPPGLFRGRGEHPKMGKLKKRIRPSDIVINIGKDAPVPECPIPGERWKEVRHDNTVTWLAYWNDPINPKEFKYVFLAASSTLKGQSDKEKYEKARLLKDYIHGIRTAYTKDFTSKDSTKKQIAVATYLIDKLALRAGNEKDDDEADTVGCCTLKVENVEPVPPNILKFDFLGKDSIRYQNEVEVETPVFKAIQQFRSGKKGNEDLFEELDTSKLNAHLKGLMPGLTAKVFRTYNASITLDDMLSKDHKAGDVAEKTAVYNHANKEVAIICNHQRTVSKSHSAQMTRLNEKIDELKSALEDLQTDLARAKKGKPPLKSADGKPKRSSNPDAIEKKIAQTTAKIEKIERDKLTKEDLKTVALGTSKINYLDPRITVAWCKRQEVPIEKMFNKSLLAKFAWAMDVEPDFRF